jgi:hypothetical protein
MTLAASEAVALGRCLAAGTDALWPRYLRAIRPQVDLTWDMSTGEDLRYPEISGPRPWAQPLLHRYLARVHRAASRDATVLGQFFRVVNLLDPPTSMLTPPMLLRVLRHGRRATP